MYKIVKNSTAGRKGQTIDVTGNRAKQLEAAGIIAKIPQYETKVVAPEETKRKPKKAKAHASMD